jgi:hypothetical protein
MSGNPYESPKSVAAMPAAERSSRAHARFWLRLSAAVLFLPALYNYWAFDRCSVARLPDDLAALFRALNLAAFAGAGVMIWVLGLPLLEAIARLIRAVLASGTERVAWEDVLYRSLRRTIYLAVPAAALWSIWVFYFYQMRSDFYAISWAVGIPAHILGACWYVPLSYEWYQLAASRPAHASPHT